MTELIEITPERIEEYNNLTEEMEQAIRSTLGDKDFEALVNTRMNLSPLDEQMSQEERERHGKIDALVKGKYEEFKNKYPGYLLPDLWTSTGEQNFRLVFMRDNYGLIDAYLREHASEI